MSLSPRTLPTDSSSWMFQTLNQESSVYVNELDSGKNLDKFIISVMQAQWHASEKGRRGKPDG